MDKNKKPGIGFGVMVLKEGKVLLGKRHEDSDKASSELKGEGSWTMPGGKLHFKESFENGAKREMMEETGIKLSKVRVICVNNDLVKEAHFVTIGLFSDDFEGEPQVMEPDEITEWGWFDLDGLPAPVYFPSKKILENYMKKVFYVDENVKYSVVEEIRKFVEAECKKPRNKYTYEVYTYHFVPMVNYAKRLAEKFNADLEIVELGVWLHDIGIVIYGRENHEITGAKIAEEKLKELNYPNEKIEKVKECILFHRGNQGEKGKSIEAQIVADADSMEHFDSIGGLFKVNFILQKDKDQREITKFIRQKLINSYNKLSSKAKQIIKPKYGAAMLLLE